MGVGEKLQERGFNVPEILHRDLKEGIVLVSHLGTGSVLDENRQPVRERYMASAEALVHLHQQAWADETDRVCDLEDDQPHIIPHFDHDAMMIEVNLLPEWYAPYQTGGNFSKEQEADFHSIWESLIEELSELPQSLILRDFHSPNIIWCEQETAHRRVGLIDFQDALAGPTSYDLASLAQDARVDVSEELEFSLVEHYCCLMAEQPDFDKDLFLRSYAIMTAQRATKLHGIFVRLSQRDGKHAYLDHLPRMEEYLDRSLRHPVLAPYKDWVSNTLGR